MGRMVFSNTVVDCQFSCLARKGARLDNAASDGSGREL
jgi:hypothetical protein